MLAEQGWHAVAPDLRGYGGTTRPADRAAYRMERIWSRTWPPCSTRWAPARRLLIAHDWGALIAWQFAIQRDSPARWPDRHERAAPGRLPAVLRRSPRQLARSWYVFFFQLPLLPELLLGARGARAVGDAFAGMAVNKAAFPPDVLDHYRRAASQPGALTAMINYYRANLGSLATNQPHAARAGAYADGLGRAGQRAGAGADRGLRGITWTISR